VSFKLGIIGGGVMAEAILSRLLEENICGADKVLVSEPLASRRTFFQQQYGVLVSGNNREVFYNSDVLLLTIKPQVFELVSAELEAADHQESNPLVISILAGVTLSRLQRAFPHQPIVRAMPNTAATIGASMTAIAPGKEVSPSHLSLARSILAAVGEVVEVSESLMDGVTGLSGSGPAFVAMMVEALADGGVAAGLPRQLANQLALQTVLGTAQLLKESNLHPAQLKDRVTSPGGTTIAGVAQLEKRGFRSAVMEAVRAASLRSQELAQISK
jgi:pyrroline-5-carboxylate reductase